MFIGINNLKWCLASSKSQVSLVSLLSMYCLIYVYMLFAIGEDLKLDETNLTKKEKGIIIYKREKFNSLYYLNLNFR